MKRVEIHTKISGDENVRLDEQQDSDKEIEYLGEVQLTSEEQMQLRDQRQTYFDTRVISPDSLQFVLTNGSYLDDCCVDLFLRIVAQNSIVITQSGLYPVYPGTAEKIKTSLTESE